MARLLEGPLQVGGRTCLLVDLAGERTLAAHLGRGRLTLDQLRRWGHDLLEMLALLEREGLVHRDIKPANLGVLHPAQRRPAAPRALRLLALDASRATTWPPAPPATATPSSAARVGRPTTSRRRPSAPR